MNRFLQYPIFALVILGMMIHHPAPAEELRKPSATTPKDNRSDHTFAILVNPLVPFILDIVENEIDQKEAKLIGIGATDFNLRTHHLLNKEMGYTLQFEYSQLSLFTQTTYVGIRGGPRFSFRKTGLTGWSWTPFLLLGRNVLSAGTYSLCSWTTAGAGVEIDLTWFWGNVLFDMGLGGYSTHNFAYAIYSDTFADTSAPAPLSSWKPLLTMGVGYAF